MKKRLEGLLQRALLQCAEGGVLKSKSLPPLLFEVPKERAFGDLASTVAMVLARAERTSPRALAEAIVRHIEDADGLLEATEIAGPGYINFRFSRRFWEQALAEIERADYAPAAFGQGRSVMVEFVSANPTGPLTIGHGRNAVLGDAMARLLEATGHRVTREYYFNDAGRQMRVLAQSLRARYLQLLGDAVELPDEGYQGEYLVDVARALVAEVAAGWRDADEARFKGRATEAIFADI